MKETYFILLLILSFSLVKIFFCKKGDLHKEFLNNLNKRQVNSNESNNYGEEDSSRLEMIKNLETQSESKTNTKKIIKNRYSESGDKCKLPFVYGNKTYQDCTKDVTPEGTVGEKEWCIIELELDTADILTSAATNSQRNIKSDSTQDMFSWGYCKQILDHNTAKKRFKK